MSEEPKIGSITYAPDYKSDEPQSGTITGDVFKDATIFWQMCPHYYRNEDLYQAFKARLLKETNMEEWLG
jgi:hypothetical protein